MHGWLLLSLTIDEREPVVDLALLDQFQSGSQQRLFSIGTTRFDDAAHNQRALWRKYLRELWGNRADDMRDNICQRQIVLPLLAGRFFLAQHARHNADAPL